MSELFTPRFGARFHLDRIAVSAETAEYSVKVFLPAALHHQRLRIQVGSGECVFAELARTPDAAPALDPWMTKYLAALARQLFRAAKKDGAWQRRLMRWHGSADEERPPGLPAEPPNS